MKLHPIITCEHAGNSVPRGYGHLFEGLEEVLRSHRGWDPGAGDIAEYLAEKLEAPIFKCGITRLLVEPNRSLTSTLLFSEYSQRLTASEREAVLKHYYFQHRDGVEELIKKSPKSVLHLSIHTFSPVWNDTTRQVDVGLLFDPARSRESAFCGRYLPELNQLLPSLRIEFNEPYKGIDDGFTTYLRTLFGDDQYLGIEIEINQKYVGTDEWSAITKSLYEGLRKFLK
jgi:predicted N-formylglutamate amidohydrolase